LWYKEHLCIWNEEWYKEERAKDSSCQLFSAGILLLREPLLSFSSLLFFKFLIAERMLSSSKKRGFLFPIHLRNISNSLVSTGDEPGGLL